MAKGKEASIEVMELTTKTLQMRLVGTSPMICNAMSEKVKQGLLLPPRKRNRAALEAKLKHDPIAEYRSSVYRAKGDEVPTRIVFPGGGFKAAIAAAALDIPGATKSQIGRLCWVNEWNIHVYGIPQLLMSVVRNSDMAKTPDIRSRAIIPEWAAEVSVSFSTPQLSENAVANLAAAAGVICGLGDWRPQRGKGAFGQYRLASGDDAAYDRIVQTGGREAQDEALKKPTTFDVETSELYEWWEREVTARGFNEQREVA